MDTGGQLWGTFAVDDHLAPRAFVAETLLFDCLVIPRPHPDDAKEWHDLGWSPDRLSRQLSILGDRAIPVTWLDTVRARWREQYTTIPPERRAAMRQQIADGAAFDFGNIRNSRDSPAKYVTRSILVDKVDSARQRLDDDAVDEALLERIRDLDPAITVETVVAYGSYLKFAAETNANIAGPGPQLASPRARLMLGWDFVVPKENDLSDEKLLEKAVTLSRHHELQASRQAFHDWRRRLIANQVTVERARQEMERCLKIYNAVVRKSARIRQAKTALQITAAAAPLADLAIPGLGTAAGVVFGGIVLAADGLVPTPQVGSREAFVALVHDARKAFKWH